MAGASTDGFDVHANLDLRGVLAQVKQVDPMLARALRKRLRQSGDQSIKKMRDILAEPSKGLVTNVIRGAGQDARGYNRRSLAIGVETTGGRGRSKGTRQAISKGIKIAVRTGAKPSTQGIRLTSSAPSVAPMARSYNKLRWRHPIIHNPSVTSPTWVMQAGAPYFGKVVTDDVALIRENVLAAIDEAITQIGT